jgi:hypothetical protein
MRSLASILIFALLGCGDDGSTDRTTIDETGQTTMTTSSGVESSSGSEGGSDPDGVVCFFAPAPCMAGEVCCTADDASVCQAADAICDGQLFVCDGAEDCGDQLCCGTDNGSTECADSCTGYHICNGDDDCNEGESCCPNGGGLPNGGLQHCTTLADGEECPQPP